MLPTVNTPKNSYTDLTLTEVKLMFKLLFSMTVTILKVTTISYLTSFHQVQFFTLSYTIMQRIDDLLQEIFKIIFEQQISAFIYKFKTF